VGYGDISGYSGIEKFFCIFLMLLGVISFSLAISFLSQILSQYDKSEKQLREDLKMLEELR